MHKTDLIWGGTWGGTANVGGGGMCPPGPPLATPLVKSVDLNYKKRTTNVTEIGSQNSNEYT